MYCIYKIINKINGHSYVGQHKYTDESNPMKGYNGSGKILKLAYKKYGFENFETEILYSRIRDKETVDAMEIWAIEKYKPEYNITKGGTGGNIISQLSPERYKQYCEMRSKNCYFRGKIFRVKDYMTEDEYNDYKRRLSETNRKVVHTPEWNNKVRLGRQRYMEEHGHATNYGRKFTEDHCSKISNSRKGYKWWHKGEINVQAKECPEGFEPGFSDGRKAKFGKKGGK